MNILLTGSNGYIGCELVSRLEPAHNLICIDKKTGKDINNLTIKDLEEVEVVINLAASTSVWNNDYSTILSDNVIGFSKLFFLSKTVGAKFIYASSSCSCNITSLYGVTKNYNETLSRAYSYGVGLRFHNVYGRCGRPDTLYGLCLKNDSINLYNNGQNLRHFTYIDDIVSCIEKSLYLNDGLYNCYNPEEISTLDFCTEISKYKPLNINLISEERELDKKIQLIDESYTNLIQNPTNIKEGIYESLYSCNGKK